jgi:uncharacterized protein (AIM24 family)
MARFDIEQEEGMRWLKVSLRDETVRTRKGALNHMTGGIVMDAPLPGFHDILVSCVSDESPWRPRFTGTGELFLESTLGGYHVMELDGRERWVFGNGTYWASEGDVRLSIYRERFWTSFWAGEGFFWYHTVAEGEGKVALYTEGPVEERTLRGEKLVVAGNYVIGRTEGIRFTIRRAAKSLISHWLSGERSARVYEGTGKLLLCTTPYWQLRLKQERSMEPAVSP